MITSKEYDEWKTFEKKVAIDASGEKCRLSKEPSGSIFRLAPGKSRRGWRYAPEQVLPYYTLIKINEAEQWKKSVDKVVKKLTASGLWPELRIKYINLAKVEYEDLRRMKHIYNMLPPNTTGKKRFFGEMVQKYPFIFDCERGVDTFYLWEYSTPKTKSMYFGKYSNSYVKAEIKTAIEEKKSYETMARTSYDVSFRYDPELNKAWYSEEYKDCGNGHYYLAIDANTALFAEDD